MTYSHMGRPHTTIGDASFHCSVRDGIRWFQRSMVVKQFGCCLGVEPLQRIGYVIESVLRVRADFRSVCRLTV